MKVLEILKEGELEALKAATLETVGPTSGTEGMIKEIQLNLKKHGLKLPTGQILPPPAYAGTVNGIWDQPLSDAIKKWKQSINLQFPRDKSGAANLQEDNIIRHTDIDWLLHKAIKADGMIDTGRNTDPSSGNTAFTPLAANLTYNAGPLVKVDPSTITNTVEFINAIGFTGWVDIKTEMLNLQEGNDDTRDISNKERGIEFGRFWTQVNDNREEEVDKWATHWRNEILASQYREIATLDNGSTMPLNPPGDVWGAGPAGGAAGLYEYFFKMADGLHKKFARMDKERKATKNQLATDPTAATLNPNSLSVMATDLKAAFENSIVAGIVPGGKGFSNDLEAIDTILRKLKTSQDYNNLAEEYARQNNGEKLDETLADELKDEDYDRIVRTNLGKIRRISPRAFHSAIKFTGDSVNVAVNDKTYTVERATIGGRIRVKDGETVVKNAILEDAVLREAVAATGGTVPNLFAETSAESKSRVGAAFVVAVDASYPELVAWYTYQEPFSTVQGTPDVGGMRLRGIVDEGAMLLTSGMTEADLINWITEEISSDHLWLIGDGSEENPGLANIRFDKRYESEGLSGRNLPVGDLDSEATLTEEEEEILSNLRTKDDIQINNAIASILELDDPVDSYERIYRKYLSSNNSTLDEDLSDSGSIESMLEGVDDGSPLYKLVASLRMPVAAPYLMAKAFKESQKGTFGFDWTGTNEELSGKLINLITSRKDYDLVNERYTSVPGVNDDLIDDMAGEEWFGIIGGEYYNKLAAVIGEDGIEIREQNLPEAVKQALETAMTEPNLENFEKLDSRLNTNTVNNLEYEGFKYIIDQLKDLGDDVENETVTLDDESMAIVKSILDRLIPIANEKYEGTWGDFFNPNWFRWVTFQGDVPGWLND
tara:strand:- start:91 stop:2751 length:2661 start_codon:yes stop_codon:yes gene_type:complete